MHGFATSHSDFVDNCIVLPPRKFLPRFMTSLIQWGHKLSKNLIRTHFLPSKSRSPQYLDTVASCRCHCAMLRSKSSSNYATMPRQRGAKLRRALQKPLRTISGYCGVLSLPLRYAAKQVFEQFLCNTSAARRLVAIVPPTARSSEIVDNCTVLRLRTAISSAIA